MATSFQTWARSYTARPEVAAQLDKQLAEALVRDRIEKDRIAAPYRESYERGLAEFERRVAESRAKQERRQGGTPDAAIAESKVGTTLNDEHEDTELRCAKCDSTNITLSARHGADEFGVEDTEDGAWCWDCEDFVEYAEVALPESVLRRILEAVAA
jgi:hypothetical protein